MVGDVPRKRKNPVPQQTPQPSSTGPLSHERVIDAIVSTLTPEQALQMAREVIAERLGDRPMSELLGFVTSSQPVSARARDPRKPKDYLGDIVDVTIVSKDRIGPNAARVIMRTADGRSFMWDATSAHGIALEPGQKKRITATIVGPEGGHIKVSRVRFYDKSAKPPVRFTR